MALYVEKSTHNNLPIIVRAESCTF